MTARKSSGYFYQSVRYARTKDGWKTAFDGERLKGAKLTPTCVDAPRARSWPVRHQDDARVIKSWSSRAHRDPGPADDLIGRYLAGDVIDESNGEVFFEPATRSRRPCSTCSPRRASDTLTVLAIDHVNVGPYVRSTLAIDRNASREDALIDIYRVMRPGERRRWKAPSAVQRLFLRPGAL